MRLKLRSSLWLIVPALATMLTVCPLMAQVQTDGSMGPAVTLSGNMVISNTLGKQVGANLFHSFSLFNILTGESVLFTSSFAGATKNVIGRVTGTSPSWIDGFLTCDIPRADLWLINPNGIAFGSNAEVYVPGSFHATTADYLAFEDGKRYSAKSTAGSDALLSVANPSAFGFLGAKPAPIMVNDSLIQVGEGKSLSFVGGDIDIAGSTIGALVAPGGRIDLVSAAGVGQARLNKSGAMDVGSFSGLGNISLRDGIILDVSNPDLAGGSIFIRGGRFVMTNNSSIWNTTGSEDGGPIDIGVTGDVSISGKSSIWTFTNSFDSGRAGHIRINAGGDFTISGKSGISSMTFESFGDSGDISVSARNVRIADGGKISTQNLGSLANAGAVSVKALDSIVISGGPVDFGTGIESFSLRSYGDAGKISLESKKFTMNGGAINTHNFLSVGAAGDISVKVGTMELAGEAIISSSSRGYGPGGTLTIQASERASLAGESSVQSTSFLTGSGGLIQISTPDLALDHSQIETSTIGSGKAGDIAIAVKGLTLASSAISSESWFAPGAAGNISIVADSGIALRNTGTSGLDRSRIVTATSGSGNAGSITISSPRVVIDDAYVDSSTFLSTGNSGTIKLNANDLVLSNGGSVSTQVAFGAMGRGGTIEINAPGSVSCFGTSPTIPEFSSTISASSYSFGNAGQISITTGNLSLSLDGSIEVASFAEGSGGNLRINAGAVTIDGSKSFYKPGLFSGAYGSGNGGDILLSAGQVNLVNGVISAKSTDVGKAGSLTLNIGDALRLKNSTIWTSSELSAGGNIGIKVGDRLWLQNSLISASANGVTPTDNGGNLTIGTPQFMILNRGDLLANANAGNGGNITLAADYFLKSGESRIDASSRQGLDGQVLIDSPNEVTGTVAVLEVPLLDISEILRERCAANVLRERSSFTIEGKGGISPRPGGLIVSPVPDESSLKKAPAAGKSESKPRKSPSGSASGNESREMKK